MIKIANYAGHGGTVGATGGGHTEEKDVLQYVRDFLNPLYQKDNRFEAYWYGDEAHEMDTDDNYINDSFHLVMSHHMDGSTNPNSTGGCMLYNKNPEKVKQVGFFIGSNYGKFGLSWRGNIQRRDLDMLYGERDNVPRGLFEMGFITNPKDHSKVDSNRAGIAQLEYEAVCNAFGISPLNVSHETKPATPIDTNKTWFESAKGAKFGSETVVDAYEERGTWKYTNVPHSLSIYPDYPQAMKNKEADPNVFMVNGDIFDYWAVIRTDKYDYLIYDRDNGRKGCVSIRNKNTGHTYGHVV